MSNLSAKSAILDVIACDIRKNILLQGEHAVDRGVHIGGAMSAVVPLTVLYFGNIMQYRADEPNSTEQDIFLMSKGHAVAALAATYAQAGYFSFEHLKCSRGWGALIKGHPGPNIPGVPIATGPLGQGISVACGYALHRKEKTGYDVYCMVGDGELQEGSCWEGIAFASEHRLGNLCVLVDKNNGQSDSTTQLLMSAEQLSARLEAFGFAVLHADGREMSSVLQALTDFKQRTNPTRPTAIICESIKGYGGGGALCGKHKASFTDTEIAHEYEYNERTRVTCRQRLGRVPIDQLQAAVTELGLQCSQATSTEPPNVWHVPTTTTYNLPHPHSKALQYVAEQLPDIGDNVAWEPSDVVSGITKTLAADDRFYTIDADLSNVSGMYAGTYTTNRAHAINAGIAELNMMCMAEGLAATGANVWVSTFGAFFNWQALRRIAVSYHERAEIIESRGGWLTEGDNLDITFLSTAANLDGAVNGATHISNDDNCVFGQLPHLKIIDICCARQLLAVAKWIAEGSRGLVYLRVMRNGTLPIYNKDYRFVYGKATVLRNSAGAKVTIVTSGHGVIEALDAHKRLARDGIALNVVDMASYDRDCLQSLCSVAHTVLFYEQNNGYLFGKFAQDMASRRLSLATGVVTESMSARNKDGSLQFVQSGTYVELITELGLAVSDICAKVKSINR